MSQWFEMSTGSLVVGEAAYAERLEQLPPGDLVPLADLLLGNVATEGAMKAPKGTYEIRTTNDELEAYGAWLLNIARSEDADAILKTPILRHAHELGLGINPEAIMDRFGSVHELRLRIGSPTSAPPGSFKNWSTEDYVDNARKLLATLGNRKPKRSDYREWSRAGNGPGLNVIEHSVVGGITRLNAHLGFPDVSSFEYDDFIDWGVRVMHVNNGTPLGLLALTVLSKRDSGPSEGSIYKHFDSIPSYTSLVAERYAYAMSEQEKHSRDILSRFDTLDIPSTIKSDEWTEVHKIQFTARFNVAAYCLPGTPREKLFTIANNSSGVFVSAIQQHNPDLSAGHVEVVAEALGVFDDIWQLYPNDKRLLKVSDKEIDAERAKRRASKRAHTSRKQYSENQSTNAA